MRLIRPCLLCSASGTVPGGDACPLCSPAAAVARLEDGSTWGTPAGTP